MNICQDSKINCQLTDQKTESILNDLEQITFNNDSTIVITIQKSYIQTYFQKNEDLKSISSFNVLKDKQYSQLQYLTFSNSFIAIPKSQILISSLNGLNARKFILKIDHGLGLCYKLLLNKNENILFLSYFSEIRIFQKQIIGWKCIDTLQSLSHRDTIQQLCLNFEEDHLVIHTSNGYSGSPNILVYRKKSIDNQIQWVIKQRISVENGMICGFINNNQFLFSDNYSLQFYTQNKDNQKFESKNYYNYILSNYQFKSFAFQLQNQVLFIITKNELSIIQLQEQQKLEQRQLIQIDLFKLLEADVSTNAFNSILTKDGKYLYIWNGKKTKIIRILNN